MTHHLAIEELVLKSGGHNRRGKESVCLMEAVAWFAHEKHSDHPECVSPVLGAFGRAWNDGMRSDEERESLKQYIPMLVGTAGDAEADERRAWMAVDWLVRVATPAWLRLAGLDEHADRLAALQPITNAAYAASVQVEIEAARESASAARDAAGAAARDAAWAAARDAAWDAAWAAARDAAWAAAWDAARDAAGAAAGAAARDAAWAAAWDAARDAAGAALEPTVIALQASGHDLFDRMIRADEIPASWPALVIASPAGAPVQGALNVNRHGGF